MGFLYERVKAARRGSRDGGVEKKEVLSRVFRYEGDPTKPLIALALKDPGGTRFLLPALHMLIAEGYPILVYMTGYTRDNQDKEAVALPHGFFEEHSGDISKLKPRIVIRTSADRKKQAPSSLPDQLVRTWDSATVIDVEDYPGASSRNIPTDARKPDYLLVMNDIAKKINEDRRPDMGPEHIVATGNPAFDHYAKLSNEARLQKRTEARSKLGVSDSHQVVLFSGQNPPATPIALKQTVAALNRLSHIEGVVLLFSRHPRDTSDYSEILSEFKGQVVVQSAITDPTTKKPLTSDVAGWGADLLVSTHSTEALHSMYREIPTLHLGLGELMKQEDYQQYSQPPFPEEVSFWIPNGDDIEAVAVMFERAVYDISVREEKRKAGLSAIQIQGREPDGKSAERVASVIVLALQETSHQ
jgi:hypothetical protein